jgi:signal transduction histidine kinase
MEEIFSSRLPHIYFVYGLAFFAFGLALALELGRTLDSRFKRALRPLVVFGLVHGFHEWFEMFELIGQQAYGFVPSVWLEWTRLIVLAFSFLSLSAFGLDMLRPSQQLLGRNVWFLLTMLSVYLMGILEIGAWSDWSAPDWLRATDAWTRYTVGIPGALLAAWGLLIQRRLFIQEGLSAYVNSLVVAALAFALYGAVGQLMVPPSPLFPSTVINSERFLSTFGVPIQLFRALMATLVAVSTIRALRAFDVNRRRQLAIAQQQAQEAIARRDALRGELLRRSVNAQEEERRRIARELHDEIGQTLTGLAAGLRGVQQSLNGDLNRARSQLRQLEGMTVKAIGELSNLVTDLRPSLLDDMGLHAALGWYTDEITRRGPTQVELVIEGLPYRLPPEVETTLFRITQEALTNVIRHAEATRAVVELVCDEALARLRVSDDGVGFAPATVLEGETQVGWGLVGIRERVQMAGGDCHIESALGEGTTLTVEIPLLTLKEREDVSHQTDAG